MYSQGSNSVRTISRAAFAPMSGDPLSQEVSTPSASSTKSVYEVASRPVDKRAMKPVHETVSTSSHPDEEEDEDMTVSCEDL